MGYKDGDEASCVKKFIATLLRFSAERLKLIQTLPLIYLFITFKSESFYLNDCHIRISKCVSL